MRGRLSGLAQNLTGDGNTPAYAGKTSCTFLYAKNLGKHPRVCGEDLLTATSAEQVRETPPRMRGRPLVLVALSPAERNTPAYAGKTT